VTSTIRTPALFALFALGLAFSAAAQPPGSPPADSRHGPRPMAGEMHDRMQAMHEARERQHAADLRTVLRLRPDQEGALTAFLQSHRPPMGPEGRRGPPGAEGPAPGAAMTTPQRLDAMARREAEHAAMRQKHVEALKTFYAALSPDQRQVFDALQRMHGPEGGHGGGRWGGRRAFGGPPGED